MMATVKTERHFVEIGGKMLCADIVPSAHNSALQEGECGFYSVGVNQTGNVFLLVLDGFVFGALILVERKRIDRGFICNDNADIFADIVIDNCADGFGFRVARMDESQFSIALADSDYDILLAARHVLAGLSADVCFVHFNRAVEHGLCFLHCGADAMAQIPRCFIGADAERALNLASGHPLFRFAEKERSGEPLLKRQVRVIENRASRHGKLIVTLFAVEQMLFSFELHDGQLATQAARPFWEAQAREQFTALGIGGEHGVYVN